MLENNNQNQSEPHNKRKFYFKIFAAIITLFIILFIIYWNLVISKHITTDNAYASADYAQITSPVSAIVNDVLISDTNIVKKDDILVILDNTDLKIDLKQAELDLAKANFDLLKARKDFERRKNLDANVVSKEEINHAQSSFEVAEASLLNANAKLDQARVNLERSVIKAPISGIIAKKEVKLGQQVLKGDNLLSIIPLDKIYVNANYKESQLRNVKIGDKAKITADFYGDKVIYRGEVVGIAGGTGSVFAIIPAQNATGNWIKVVQRVPVKISINPEDLKKYPLRLGLSMNTDIITSGE